MKPMNAGARVLIWFYNATDDPDGVERWVGHGAKAPSLLQLSPDWATNSCRGGCRIIGSPDLKPETSESWELGLTRGEEGILGVEASVATFVTMWFPIASALAVPLTLTPRPAIQLCRFRNQ